MPCTCKINREKKENCMYNIFLYPFCKKAISKYETTLLSSGFFGGRITPWTSINMWLLISDIQVSSPLFLLKIETHFYDLISHTLSNTLINSYLISQPESRQTSLKIKLWSSPISLFLNATEAKLVNTIVALFLI